jgi:hypothetical protein
VQRSSRQEMDGKSLKRRDGIFAGTLRPERRETDFSEERHEREAHTIPVRAPDKMATRLAGGAEGTDRLAAYLERSSAAVRVEQGRLVGHCLAPQLGRVCELRRPHPLIPGR